VRAVDKMRRKFLVITVSFLGSHSTKRLERRKNTGDSLPLMSAIFVEIVGAARMWCGKFKGGSAQSFRG